MHILGWNQILVASAFPSNKVRVMNFSRYHLIFSAQSLSTTEGSIAQNAKPFTTTFCITYGMYYVKSLCYELLGLLSSTGPDQIAV